MYAGSDMFAKVLGWVAVVVSILVLVVFAAIRVTDMLRGAPAQEAFDVRYVQHPRSALLHIIPGLVFLALAPLQFVTRIRQRHIRFHRRLGWLLVPASAVSGVLALLINFSFPAFGGISTQAATVFFGVIFLFSLVTAVRHVRRKEIPQHREWMIRVFALAMGVATIRLFIALFTVFGYGFEEAFGTAFWLGFSVNLLVAEIWINTTRPTFSLSRTPAIRRETPNANQF